MTETPVPEPAPDETPAPFDPDQGEPGTEPYPGDGGDQDDGKDAPSPEQT